MAERLLGKNLNELTELARSAGLPAYVGRQLADWIYVKGVRTLEEMTNLSKVRAKSWPKRAR